MKYRTLLRALGVLCGSIHPLCRAAVAIDLSIPYERYQVANGLTVILHEDHSTPQVAVNLWYRVGSADERPGKTGFAHLFEHLMFMGSRHAPEGAFDRLMEAEGGENNASTDEDRTNYFEQGPSHLLETFLWLEADRMATLGSSLGTDALNRQRDVVRNELRESYENQPYGSPELLLPPALYPRGHPYHWPVIGSHRDLQAASLADVQAFFARFYVPSNASMVIAGDFEPATTRAWVDRYFAWIPSPPPPLAPSPPRSLVPSQRRLTVSDRVALPRVSMLWHSPSFYTPGDAECDLLASILGRGRSSRLYRELVYRRQIALDVTAHQESRRLGSLLRIDVTARPGHTVSELERAIDAQLDLLRRRAPSPRELQRAKNAVEADFIHHLEPLSARADTLNQYQFYLGDPGALSRDRARYRQATAEGIHRIAAERLRPERRLTLVVVPRKDGGGQRAYNQRAGARRASFRRAMMKIRHSPGANEPAIVRRLKSQLRKRQARLRGLRSQSAKADFAPFQPAVSTAGGSVLWVMRSRFAEGARGGVIPLEPPSPDQMAHPPPLGAPRPVRLPAVRRFRLANGLQAVLVENHRLPIVALRMSVRRGAGADPQGKVGLADLTAEMLDEGAGRRSAPQIADELEFLAAELETSAGYDETTVELSALKRSLSPAMALFADVVRRPRFQARELARVRAEALAELAQRRTEPEEVADLVFARAVYGDTHPYGRPIDGYVGTVRAIHRRDVIQFHRRAFRPEHALLVAAGDLTDGELRALVTKAFGNWRSTVSPAAAPSPKRYDWRIRRGRLTQQVKPRPRRVVIVDVPGAPQSVLRLGHPGPARSSPDYAALEAMNVVLGGAFTSRLNQNLRERHGFSYGASSGFTWERGPGPFKVGTSVFRNQTADALRECLLEMTLMGSRPVSEEELRKGTATLREGRVRALAGIDGTVDLYAAESLLGLPPDETVRLLARLPRLTEEDLRRAAARYLHPGEATIVIVGDARAIRPSVVALRLGALESRDADGRPIHGRSSEAPTGRLNRRKKERRGGAIRIRMGRLLGDGDGW